MTRAQLIAQIQAKKSVLCVGLDPDMDKMPAHFPRTAEGLANFCCAIIDATAPYAVAYKPNLAFFEALGVAGWQALARVADHLRRYPHHLSIADAKRGDIGNTATKYAQGILNELGFDSITVAPYMGQDSLQPFALPGNGASPWASRATRGPTTFSFSRWPMAVRSMPMFWMPTALGCLQSNGWWLSVRRAPKASLRSGPSFPSTSSWFPGLGPRAERSRKSCALGRFPVIWAC